MTEQEAPQQLFEIQRIYLKDSSFESPVSPAVFIKPFNPDSNVELHSNTNKLGENLYEVELSITLTVKSDNEVAYLVEVKQAGVFSAKGYSDEQMGTCWVVTAPISFIPLQEKSLAILWSRVDFRKCYLRQLISMRFTLNIYKNRISQRRKTRQKNKPSIKHPAAR